MRPVNLIPPEDRRGDRAPARTGAVPYVIVAGLAVALVAVTAVVLIGKQISEREVTVAALEAREAAVSVSAEALRPYADFDQLAAARDATVTSLAQSRFDWERVLRELALVIPDDVWLTEASGNAGAASQVEGAAAVDASVTGPSLSLVGCGANHEAVATFVAALRDIDGVTRVGISSSERAEASGSTATTDSASAGGEGGEDCRTGDMIAKFEVIAAFDEVPVAPQPGVAPVPTAPGGSTPAVPQPAEAVADLSKGDAR